MKIEFKSRWELHQLLQEMADQLCRLEGGYGPRYISGVTLKFTFETEDCEAFEIVDEFEEPITIKVSPPTPNRKPRSKTPRKPAKGTKPQTADVHNIADFRKGKS